MKRSTKKGFTIVELVIVIAIIAILAAVLIPTFASLIQKANESKDTQLVRNLNTALKTDGKEHKTMQDALDAAEAFGYDVGKINASATDNEILWDSVNDAFCYYNKDKGVEYLPQTELKDGKTPADYLLWKIYTSEEKVTEDVNVNKVYSIYWNSDAAYAKELKAGFDAGECTAITTLNYVRTGDKQDVVIRTNGGTLTVNAPADTVNHYGYATVVTVTEVAKESYHENGKVDEIKLAKGRVVVESDGEVGSVMVTASAAADVKVENKSGKLGGVAASNSEVASNLKNQVTGVDESKVLNTVVDNSKFAGGLGTEDAPYLIATAEQFINITSSKDKPGYYKLTDNIVLPETYKTIDCFYGIFNGNGHIISRSNYDTSLKIFTYVVNATIKNLVLIQGKNLTSISEYVGYNGSKHWDSTVTFENINVLPGEFSGTTLINSEKSSSFTSQIVAGNCYFDNCVVDGNYANVSGVEYLGIFVGNYIGSSGGTDNSKVSFDSCIFKGHFFSPRAGLLAGQGNGDLYNYTVDIKDCDNKGVIISSISLGVLGMVTDTQTKAIKINDDYKSILGNNAKNAEDASNMTIKVDSTTKEVIIENGSTDYTYFVSFRQSAKWYKNNLVFGSDYFIVKNMIENKSGEIKTGVYKNKVSIVNETLNQDKAENSNWKYIYDNTKGYTVEGKVSDTEYYEGNSGNTTPMVTIYVFAKNADDSLVVKGVYTVTD